MQIAILAIASPFISSGIGALETHVFMAIMPPAMILECLACARQGTSLKGAQAVHLSAKRLAQGSTYHLQGCMLPYATHDGSIRWLVLTVHMHS